MLPVIIFILIALLSAPAAALEGELAGNRFPYVVRIVSLFAASKPNGCTATVLEPRLLITAAHCIAKPYSADKNNLDLYHNNISKNISFSYTDSNGKSQSAGMAYAFLSQHFLRNIYLHDQIIGDKPKPSLSDTEKSKSWAHFRIYMLHDFAYIVPNKMIYLSQYPRFILNEFKPVEFLDSARYFSGDWNLTNDSFDKGNLTFFKKFYYFPKEAVTVGFGGWGCKKGEDGSKIAKTCTQDYKQRFATVPFDNYDRSVKISDDYTIKARVPWVWALGKRAEIDRNPMVYGDSGGPVFVNDKPGQQPMLIGVNSSSNWNSSDHPSPLLNPSLWKMAVESAAYKALRK